MFIAFLTESVFAFPGFHNYRNFCHSSFLPVCPLLLPQVRQALELIHHMTLAVKPSWLAKYQMNIQLQVVAHWPYCVAAVLVQRYFSWLWTVVQFFLFSVFSALVYPKVKLAQRWWYQLTGQLELAHESELWWIVSRVNLLSGQWSCALWALGRARPSDWIRARRFRLLFLF